MTVPAPLPMDEAERLAVLRKYAILDSTPEAGFDRIAKLAARQFDVPIALISLIDEDRQWFKAACGIDATETGRDVAFCAHAILEDEVLYVPDARKDKRFADNPFVTDGIAIRFYAGAPLTNSQGFKLGTLCLIDDKPRHDFSDADKSLLQELAALVVDQIEMRLATGNVLGEVEGRLKAEDERAFVEHQLGLFFEHAPVSVAMLDTELRYIGASRQWCETHGLDARAIVGVKHVDLLPHLPESWRKQYQACLAGENIHVEEDRLPRQDGGFHWVQRDLRPWRRSDGTIGGIIVSNTIIDERKEAASALERNKTFFEAVLENIEDGIVACDAEGNLSLFNAATRRFHGVDAESLPPEEWAERYDLYEADGETPLAMENIPLFKALSGETVDGQGIVIAARGQPPRRLVVHGTAMHDSAGNKLGAVVSMHDVTKERSAEERWREAESRYRAIFNHTFQFCGWLDLEGTLLEANDTAIDFAGLTREELIGLPFWECHWWQVGEKTKSRLKAAIERAKSGEFVRYEVEVQGAGGARIPIDFSIKPVTDARGNVAQLIVEGRDISDKRETETQLRLVTDSLPFYVSRVDANGHYRFINRTGAAWLDSTKEAIVGRTVADYFGKDDLARLEPHVNAVLLGETTSFETALDHPDGAVRDVHCIYVPEQDENGTVHGYLCIAMDISDRKRAETEARSRAAQLELILDNVPIRIFYKDDKNRILRLNEPAAKSMGMTVREAEGADTYDLFPEIAKKYHVDDLEVIESGRPKLGIIEPYKPETGKQGWVRTDKVPYTDPDSGERFVFVAASDITAEKEAEEALRASEERYRLLYNNTPVMLHSIDREGRLLSVSDFWLEKLGYERKEVIGRKSTEFLTPESREKAVNELIPEFLRAGRCKDVEYQMVTKSGETVDILLSAIAERDEEGEVNRSLAVLTDITDRKVVERQFVQAQKMESVGQLTGGMAHDFNNLLGVIMGNLQLIERSIAGDEKATRRANSALAAAEKGAELTKRLLAFSRRQNLDAEMIDPNPLIQGMTDLLRRTLGEAIALDCRLADAMPAVRTDPSQLESALLNLAVNARDAMPEGGRLTIESRVVHLDEEYAARETDIVAGEYVAIAVTDTGAGIPNDLLEKVFEPFFTTKDVGKGSGLGLSMVYGFMKQSGGHVRVYSEPGHGTTVRMYLPAVRQVPLSQPAEPQSAADGQATVCETVLVVEDQAEVREVAVALLEDLGYRVVEARNGHDGLALLESGREIDLLFTDIVMPGGMDGTELAKSAASLRPGLPVVFTTGFAEAAVLRQGEVKTATNLVTKPYRRDELATKVRAALDAAKAAPANLTPAA